MVAGLVSGTVQRRGARDAASTILFDPAIPTSSFNFIVFLYLYYCNCVASITTVPPIITIIIVTSDQYQYKLQSHYGPTRQWPPHPIGHCYVKISSTQSIQLTCYLLRAFSFQASKMVTFWWLLRWLGMSYAHGTRTVCERNDVMQCVVGMRIRSHYGIFMTYRQGGISIYVLHDKRVER